MKKFFSLMKFLLELGPLSALTKPSTIGVFFAATIIFVVVPILLTVLEYQLTKNQKKYGIYLIVGTLISSVILGVYSVFITIPLILSYVLCSYNKNKQIS